MEDREVQVRIILPSWNNVLGGYSCAKQWCETAPGHACGCPACLSAAGLTLVYDIDDFRSTNVEEDRLRYEWLWRRRVVPEKTARLVRELIVPGYPGALRDRE